MKKAGNLAAIAVVIACAIAAGFVREYSGDFHWHIVLGKWMRTHHALAREDTLSYTFRGHTVFVSAWLGDVLLSFLFDAGRYALCYAARAACIVTAALLLLREMTRRGLGVAASAALVALLIAQCFFVFYLRPEMFTLPLFAGLLLVLGQIEREGPTRARLGAVLAITFLWANVHGSVAIALLAIGCFAVERAFRDRRMLALPAAALVCAMLTPEGWKTPLAFRILGDRCNLQTEWLPLGPTQLGPLVWIAIGVTLLSTSRKTSPWRAALVIGLAILAARHRRFLTPALIATLPLLAGNLATLRERFRLRSAIAVSATVVALAWAAVVLVWERGVFAQVGLGADRDAYPERAAAWVKQNPPAGPMLNAFNFGSYLLYALPDVPVAIDQRVCSLYPGSFYERYIGAAASPQALRALADSLGATWAFVEYDPFSRQMSADPASWHLLYFDDRALIYARGQTGGFRHLDPAHVLALPSLRGPALDEAGAELTVQLGRCESCYRTQIARAALAVAKSDDATFTDAMRRVGDAARPETLFIAARGALMRGNLGLGHALFRDFAGRTGDPLLAALLEARSLAETGHRDEARRVLDQAATLPGAAAPIARVRALLDQ
jgi:hypothetical protein